MVKEDESPESPEKIEEAKPVKGKTTIKVSPVEVKDIEKPSRPKIEPVPQVQVEPIRDKIRREEWVCRKCAFRWYPTRPATKCPNCNSNKIAVDKIEEAYTETPEFPPALLLPLVNFPYDMWAERTGMNELRLTPAEGELLSKNVAEVMNYYMTDWMREHGVIVAFLMAVAIVTTPRVYIWKTAREKTLEEKPIRSEIAQPEEEKLPEELEEEPEREVVSDSERQKRMKKALAVSKS